MPAPFDSSASIRSSATNQAKSSSSSRTTSSEVRRSSSESIFCGESRQGLDDGTQNLLFGRSGSLGL